MPIKAELEQVAQGICSSIGHTYVRFVGAGAFKETFETRGDERYALKVFRAVSTPQRVEREIAAMLQCRHPHIGQLRRVDVVELPGHGRVLYSLEEFLAGGTLAAKLATDGLITRERTLALGTALIGAIAHIAGHALVHRDIKPENIMLRDGDLSPVVVDFGLVRTLNAESLTATWAPQGPGTPFFSPPEQLLNEKHLVDWRSDQFSLGVTLAMCCVGRHPYQVSANEPAGDVVTRVATRAPLPDSFTKLARGVGLSSLLKMLAPWPVDRFRTPAQLEESWRRQGDA